MPRDIHVPHDDNDPEPAPEEHDDRAIQGLERRLDDLEERLAARDLSPGQRWQLIAQYDSCLSWLARARPEAAAARRRHETDGWPPV